MTPEPAESQTRRDPQIAVVVPSHDRPLRLRWLLNSLEEQTLSRSEFEEVVGHDSAGSETEDLLRTHPLAVDGVLRHATLPPGSAPPGANRNAALRLVSAPSVAFTDDDCRPPPEWLERALRSARANPGRIVQGGTYPDPQEINIRVAPQYHTQHVYPPTPWAECCNIVYPREVLEALGGFREDMYVGEDTELYLRARAMGVEKVGDRAVITYHAVEETTLPRRLRSLWRWRGLPYLVKLRPEIRQDFPLHYFWKHTHVWFPFAVAGAVLERRNPLYGLLAYPWLVHAWPSHGEHPRGRLRGATELPSRIAVDVGEIVVLVAGSVTHRRLLV